MYKITINFVSHGWFKVSFQQLTYKRVEYSLGILYGRVGTLNEI